MWLFFLFALYGFLSHCSGVPYKANSGGQVDYLIEIDERGSGDGKDGTRVAVAELGAGQKLKIPETDKNLGDGGHHVNRHSNKETVEKECIPPCKPDDVAAAQVSVIFVLKKLWCVEHA